MKKFSRFLLATIIVLLAAIALPAQEEKPKFVTSDEMRNEMQELNSLLDVMAMSLAHYNLSARQLQSVMSQQTKDSTTVAFARNWAASDWEIFRVFQKKVLDEEVKLAKELRDNGRIIPNKDNQQLGKEIDDTRKRLKDMGEPLDITRAMAESQKLLEDRMKEAMKPD